MVSNGTSRLQSPEMGFLSAGRISLTELKKTTVERVESYLDNQQVLKPRLRSQSNSQQVWLWHDDDELLQFEDLLEDYHDRCVIDTFPQERSLCDEFNYCELS